VDDIATITAIANDVGFESTFLRQIIAFGEPGDIALGISTSGNSPNVLAALTEAKRRGLVTVALAGDTGGAMASAASDGTIDHLFIARTSYTPRIQEGHATVWHTLLELVQELLKQHEGDREGTLFEESERRAASHVQPEERA
jgi:D-sedoheptulose 7-phosphate isomerase